MKRVILITEFLNPPYDEGIKKTVYNLFTDLDSRYELLVICRYGFQQNNVVITDSNPLMLSTDLKKKIKNFNPDVLIYFPFASGTFAGYLRRKVLSFYAGRARTIFVALQPKPLKKWQKYFVKLIKPEFALTPYPELKIFWDSLGIKNELLSLLTDLNTFKSLNDIRLKKELRAKYNLPLDAFIISHMGHLNEGRNLKSLIPLQQSGYQVVIVGSSSTPRDSLGPENLKAELLNEGIIVLDGYIENIEEIYQLSDIYIFPVVAKNSSIGMPLSVLEARACAVPVVTTDYGSLKQFLGDDFGGITYSEPEKFLEAVNKTKSEEKRNYSKTKVENLNKNFYNIIHSFIEDTD